MDLQLLPQCDTTNSCLSVVPRTAVSVRYHVQLSQCGTTYSCLSVVPHTAVSVWYHVQLSQCGTMYSCLSVVPRTAVSVWYHVQLSQCGTMYNCLSRSITETYQHVAGTFSSPQSTTTPTPEVVHCSLSGSLLPIGDVLQNRQLTTVPQNVAAHVPQHVLAGFEGSRGLERLRRLGNHRVQGQRLRAPVERSAAVLGEQPRSRVLPEWLAAPRQAEHLVTADTMSSGGYRRPN